MNELCILREDFDAGETWDLLDWCARKGAGEFTATVIGVGSSGEMELLLKSSAVEESRIVSSLQGFSRGVRCRVMPSDEASDVPLWSLNDQSVRLLRSILKDGLFTYVREDDEWLEDIVVFRNGGALLDITSHEGKGTLRVTQEELAELEAMGVKGRAHFDIREEIRAGRVIDFRGELEKRRHPLEDMFPREDPATQENKKPKEGGT